LISRKRGSGTRAAGEGYLPAIVLLATLYSHGKGVAKDRDEALRLLQPAAEQGYAPAQTDLAVLYLLAPDAPAHDLDAVRLLHKAAGQDPKGAFALGWCYQQERGIKRDLAQAARWYTKAANQGFAPAENNLGFLYNTGGGIPADHAAALRWYRRAAEDGISDATLSVAKLLLTSPEPMRDRHGALVWFAIAQRAFAGLGENASLASRRSVQRNTRPETPCDSARQYHRPRL
jgi:uncharacterized protein